MRSSSNPAFRNLPQGQGQGYATFDRAGGMAAGMGTAYAAESQGAPVDPGRAGVAERPITIDDVVTKTAIAAGTAIVTGTLTAVSGHYGLALPAFIVGFIVSLVLIFKPHLAKAPLVLLYSAAMGVALGGISGLLDNVYPGIALQAIVGTAGVFIGMLVVYKTGAIRVTPRLTKMIIGAAIGVLILMVANLLISFFVDGGLGLRSGGPLAIIFSLVCIGIGAFMLLLDFDQADQAVKAGVPARFAWYLAFGFMTTLVWLYIEILQLLSYFRQ